MSLRHLGFIALPPHRGCGGFDHAAVHEPTGHVYVAHTVNDAVDVMDVEQRTYLGSITGLPAVAGALMAPTSDLVFTSNRGENTVGVGRPGHFGPLDKVAVGVRPNGVACDPGRGRLLSAHVGDPAIPGSRTVSLVDVAARKVVADVPVAGRTRWTAYDPAGVIDVFETSPLRRHETVVTEIGAHTVSFDAVRHIVCAFLPATHRAAVYHDRP
jgi:DNA-binding beta-propeller fold protein YncE